MFKYYIIKQFVRRFINELSYFFRRLTRSVKSLFKIVLFCFIAVLIIYLIKGGAF